MTKHDLKELAAMGAELGAAKAEVDRLRGLLEEVHPYVSGCSSDLWQRCHAALSQQAGPAEPTDTFTAVDMATAAAQAFRDGQAAVEPAVVQDERKTFEAWAKTQGDKWLIVGGLQWSAGTDDYASARTNAAWAAWQERAALSARPAQTEQQPIEIPVGAIENGRAFADRLEMYGFECEGGNILNCSDWQEFRQCFNHLAEWAFTLDVNAAPIAQTAPQGKFAMGDRVKKSTGSEWVGRVVGWYSTEQTKEGYAVESEAHAGSVQIYPAKALEAV